MPYKSKHPCNQPGCRELTSGRYCEAHRKESNRRYNKYSRDHESVMRYGTEWRKIRAAFIQANPLCHKCLDHGNLVPAVHVHHIVPLRDGGTHDHNNLMPLCIACHSAHHAKEGTRFGDTQTPGGI